VNVQTAVFWVVTPRSIVGGQMDASVWEVYDASIFSADHSDPEDGSSMLLKNTGMFHLLWKQGCIFN
jgi:hypothetical protein